MSSAGIDIPIDKLVATFTSSLWANESLDVTFRGRIYRNEKQEGLSNFIVPEYFDYSKKEYRNVELDDKLDAIGFVDVLPDMDINSLTEANVRFCFAVNLLTLYPSEGTRATEHAHRDVYNILMLSEFKPTGLVRGAPAFSDYGFTSQTRMDMDPFYLFRFDTRIEFEINICNYE